jgi:rifampicin phosphotransferase
MTTIDLTVVATESAPRAEESASDLCLPLADATDERTVGGKAYALGRMLRAGVDVPEGIALTVRAFDRHVAPLAIDSTGNASSVRAAALPHEVREQLALNAAPLLARGPVVVRSSAVGEDGAAESFAGQLDSILHVADQRALEQAVRDVWASLWSDRAVFYRTARRLPMRGMGVVIQRQVDARVAGVLFTMTSSGEMLAEFGPGLADKLVAGEVDPGRAAIDRLTAASRELSAHAACSLTDGELRALRDVGVALEAEFGSPQDVEWAIDERGAIRVVQSRPITALVSMPAKARAVSARRIAWSNANVNENFPRPISPLLYSIASAGYTHYFRNLAIACGVARDRMRAMEPEFQRIIGVHCARMYYNLTAIHSVLRLAPFGDALTRSFDAFVGADGGGVETNAIAGRGKLRQVAEVSVIATRAAVLLSRLERRVSRFERTVDEFASRTEPTKLERMSLAELHWALTEFVEIRCRKWLDASLADGAAMISYGALQRLLRGAGLGDSAHNSLLKAIPDVPSNEPVLRLWDLAQIVRADEALRSLFESSDADAVLVAIRSDVRFAEFGEAFQRYLDDWGFRCSEELMLATPSFQEDPAPLIDVLRSYARLDGESPRDVLRAQMQARERDTRRVAASLAPTRAALLRVLLPRVHSAIRYRERARLKQALLYSRCRRIALAMGKELARIGSIAERNDVFFLTWQELLELTGSKPMVDNSTRELVATRKLEHARLSAIVPPDSFTLPEGQSWETDANSPSREEQPSSGPAVQPSSRLSGVSACGGQVTGRATVLESVTQSALLERGDVLVTKQTDPGWGPVFFLISGLVIERGGMLSHGAIIAREFGIPCVVGVKDAMRFIPSGATVMVDGDRGEVHVVA